MRKQGRTRTECHDPLFTAQWSTCLRITLWMLQSGQRGLIIGLSYSSDEGMQRKGRYARKCPKFDVCWFLDGSRSVPFLFSSTSISLVSWIQTIKVTKCKANSVPHARINICNYPKLKVALTFTLKLLIEINSKGLDLKGPGFSIRFLVDGKNLRRRRRMDNVHRRHKLVGGSGGHSPQWKSPPKLSSLFCFSWTKLSQSKARVPCECFSCYL